MKNNILEEYVTWIIYLQALSGISILIMSIIMLIIRSTVITFDDMLNCSTAVSIIMLVISVVLVTLSIKIK